MRGVCWRRLLAAIFLLLGMADAATAQVPTGQLRGVLGANKPDLLLQYLGIASSADGSPAARSVTVAMAHKSLADAHDVGFAFVRVMAAGYGPVAPPPAGNPAQNDLALWLANPALYWSRVDAMFADLDEAGIRLVPSFLWNPLQFPALAGETLTDLVANPASRSRALFESYVADFIQRYRARRTILFYELTNELNLEADIDIRRRCLEQLPAPNCAAYGNFTSAQMTAFAAALVAQIKSLDPLHAVGSGYALPRPAAEHLARQPDFSAAGPDWTADSPAQLNEILASTGAPFDLWSVHIYPGDVRFGNPPGTEARTLAIAARAAVSQGKRLYLGEFGDSTASAYLAAMLRQSATSPVAYASVWVWEFYQQATYLSASITSAPPMSLEPGFSDAIDTMLAQAAGGQGRVAPPAVRVVLTTPLPCAAVRGTLPLYATASASGPFRVSRVAFSVDGQPVGTATGVPFRAAAALAAGPHVVRATAFAGAAAATTQIVIGGGACGP